VLPVADHDLSELGETLGERHRGRRVSRVRALSDSVCPARSRRMQAILRHAYVLGVGAELYPRRSKYPVTRDEAGNGLAHRLDGSGELHSQYLDLFWPPKAIHQSCEEWVDLLGGGGSHAEREWGGWRWRLVLPACVQTYLKGVKKEAKRPSRLRGQSSLAPPP